jgi:hypothetical protein
VKPYYRLLIPLWLLAISLATSSVCFGAEDSDDEICFLEVSQSSIPAFVFFAEDDLDDSFSSRFKGIFSDPHEDEAIINRRARNQQASLPVIRISLHSILLSEIGEGHADPSFRAFDSVKTHLHLFQLF